MKKKSAKMVRAGKKAWKTRLRNKGSLRRKKGLPKRAVGFYREDGKTKPITKSVAELNRKKLIHEPSAFKNVRPAGSFKFEPIAFVWKDGQTKEIERMRIRKDNPSLITHLRIEHLVPANKGDAFFKSPRSGTVEVANEHIVMLCVPVFKEYYLVSESFTMKNAVGDPLGGFSSGRIWEIANKPKFLEVLEKHNKEGWRQVPYVQGGTTCKHCGKSLAGEPVSSFRSQTCRTCYRKMNLPLKSGSDVITKAYLNRYSQLKEAGVNPSLEGLIPQLPSLTAGTPSLVTDTITRYLRNKERLDPEDKKEISRYMGLMRPLFPIGVPKLIRDIAIAYPPSEIRGMQKRGELKPFIQKARTEITRPSPPVPPF